MAMISDIKILMILFNHSSLVLYLSNSAFQSFNVTNCCSKDSVFDKAKLEKRDVQSKYLRARVENWNVNLTLSEIQSECTLEFTMLTDVHKNLNYCSKISKKPYISKYITFRSKYFCNQDKILCSPCLSGFIFQFVKVSIPNFSIENA